ncbi:hypothetical protein L0668_02530 [Paraglaciecola aquimarina]|uniref:Uncharacterized protein n=1 Tax=Paraglaciecola algarum TaxID=3050085 RepID=A0ABS9D233_9ALTE|nr:hypothetical protein [Paraglaciecola sp. G1-23]MCF2946966.1 hypothetical protein [Paraglaciecola sp. G1-23]
MSKLDKDQVIAAYTEAYTKANGKAPNIEAKGGWYSVDGAKNIRLAELNEQISTLDSTKVTPTEKALVESNKKAEKKKSAEKTPTTAKKKAASKTKSKAKKSDFSVKAFYADRIKTENSGVKLPR